MAGFEKTAKTSRAGRFPPPRRGPRRRSCLGLLTALDAARRPSPPRPQRGPRRRRRPSPPSVPRPTPVTSTTWCLQPPSASLVLWRKPRNPPSVVACILDPGVDATAAARPELLHGNSLSTLDAHVPAIQRPSARSQRTVDNSLITSRIEYSTFLNPSHRIFKHMHGALNAVKKITNYTEIGRASCRERVFVGV